MMQYRHFQGSDTRMYAPDRDIAHSIVPMIRLVFTILEREVQTPAIQELMTRLSVTRESLGDLVVMLAKAINIVKQPELKTLSDAINMVNLATPEIPQLHHPSLYVFCAILGQLYLAAGYHALRAANRPTEPIPTDWPALLEAAEEFRAWLSNRGYSDKWRE